MCCVQAALGRCRRVRRRKGGCGHEGKQSYHEHQDRQEPRTAIHRSRHTRSYLHSATRDEWTLKDVVAGGPVRPYGSDAAHSTTLRSSAPELLPHLYTEFTEGDTPESLPERADDLLYRSKDECRDRTSTQAAPGPRRGAGIADTLAPVQHLPHLAAELVGGERLFEEVDSFVERPTTGDRVGCVARHEQRLDPG